MFTSMMKGETRLSLNAKHDLILEKNTLHAVNYFTFRILAD